ncbi:MAG: hypothetical protein ACYDHZ_00650 [Dehalococcoidia bacterium]
MSTVYGYDLQTLGANLEEHFDAGQEVNLTIAIPQDMSDEQLGTFQNELASRGVALTRPVAVGSTAEWPFALNIGFRRPVSHGVGALPFPILLIAALGVVGFGIVGGWRISDIIRDNFTPILITSVVAILGMALIFSKSGASFGSGATQVAFGR